MYLQELRPSGSLAPSWCWFNAILAEDVGNGGASDSVSKFTELTLDPFISPEPIL